MKQTAFLFLGIVAVFHPAVGMALMPPETQAYTSPLHQTAMPTDTILRNLAGYTFPVRYSPGIESSARVHAGRVASVLDRLGPRLGVRPAVSLLVLTQDDWAAHTSFPVYGMPHILEAQTLIVAGEDNPFWRGFLPDPASLPEAAATAIRQVYGDGAGGVSAAAFFDLLAIHELGHAFTSQAGVGTHRLWMGEFLPNLILHAWVEEEAQDLLPALSLLPDLVAAGGAGNHRFTTLAELEDHYVRISREHPENYGWYQLRWHQGARRVYEAAGTEVLDRLWTALRDHPDPLDDTALVTLLNDRVHPALADFVRDWDAETRSPPALHFPRPR